MAAGIHRTTVDLSAYPDLVVIYLGLRVQSLRGFVSAFKLGPQIQASVDARPEGLLLHEQLLFSLLPLHIGMRQYWRDFESLEKWVRTMPHQGWWINFLKDPQGVGFWHETYFMRGGMESIYDNVNRPVGFSKFAPHKQARGPSFSARKRAGMTGEGPAACRTRGSNVWQVNASSQAPFEFDIVNNRAPSINRGPGTP